MNVRPAGREACECTSPINQILERLDQMDADIASAQQAANTAVGTATAQAGAAAASAASAQADAAAALINAGAAQDAADDAHDEAVAAAGSAQEAADDAADALLALQNIESTIASVLATDIGAKVDKLTTAGFHLYTHNGSTQGEVAPDINPTAATIPIRDSDGKLFGADPASGATDKTLVTANWVSQTGDSAPNNLLHKSGAETAQNGPKGNITSGSSSTAAVLEVQPRWYVKSAGFDRTVNQGINKHYPIAGLMDRNDLCACKLNVVTTDTVIRIYIQFADKQGVSHTVNLAEMNRDTGVITTAW